MDGFTKDEDQAFHVRSR